MAIQMTREEYERVYGSSPVIPKSKIDTRPAPTRMTMEEYNATYRPQSKSFLDDARADIQETKVAQQSALQTGVDRSAEISDRVRSGETSKAKGAFQKFGTGLGTASNILFETALGGAKAILPQSTETKIKDFFGEYGAAMSERVKSDFQELKESDKSTDQDIVTFVDEVSTAYQDDPNFRSDVQAAGGVLEWLALPAAAEKTVAKTAGTVASGANKIDVAPLVKKVTQTSDEKLLVKRTQTLSDLEDKYATFRKLNEFSPDGGVESRNRISRTDVLNGAVDEDGVIRTKGTGGAVDQYRKATIEGVEDVVKRNLERERATISLPELQNAMRIAVNSAGLEGADLVTALKGIKREIEGLSKRSDVLGQVPLAKIQDAKISTTRNINFNTPPETKTYRKAVAKAYKEVIEKKSNFNVEEVNAELAKFYKDIERLEMLDGKRVKGGRLGKYFAQISGNIIGGAAGSAVGGPAGTALGTIAGGEAASFIAGKSMAKALGKGGILPEKNQVLAVARREAGLPEGRSLEVPDPIIGIPKATRDKIDELATPAQKKEVSNMRRQMSDNVKQQKVAIKDKDYTLVASLKDVYDSLVENFKLLVNEIVESVKNPTIGLSIRKTVTPELVAKKMDFEDFEDVARFIEDPQAALLDDKLQRLVEEIGISKADLETQTKFLIEVTDEADRLGLLQSNNLGKRNTQYQTTNAISNTDIDSTVDPKAKSVKNKGGDKSTTDPLVEEARKYDSAEEFVKAKKTYYHGSTEEAKKNIEKNGFKAGSLDDSELGAGVYITDDKTPASLFDSDLKPLEVYVDDLNTYELPDFRANPDIEAEKLARSIIERDTLPELLKSADVEFMTKRIKKTWENSANKWLEMAGYDGVTDATSQIRGQVAVFDPTKVKTRTQLEEIYKQANK